VFAAALRLADGIDAASRVIAQAVKWLAVALVLVQFGVVVLRYAYGMSYIWAQESVIYAHATLFMLAIGYTYLVDQHVRVDVLYGRWSARRKAAMDLAGIVFAVLPFCALMVWASWSYVALSWRMGEGPMAVGGLPLLPWLKSLIPLMAVLLGLQALSIGVRCAAVLAGRADSHFPGRASRAEHG
jgi:TRAP-type mannitol/chloroaromatic compound transport system permease small subunit